MYTGFVFDWIQAAIDLQVHLNPKVAAEDFMVESSEALEKLAGQLNAEYLLLNHQYCAFVLKNEKKALVIDYESSLKSNNKDRELNKLEEGLIANGLLPDNAVRLAEPEWTRCGMPINYENWEPAANTLVRRNTIV